MLAIRLFRRTEVHRDAVLHDFVLVENLIQDAQRTPAVNHEIFGYDFEPIHYGLARENMVIMWGAQTDSDAVIGKIVENVCWHQSSVCSLEWRRAGKTHRPTPTPRGSTTSSRLVALWRF